MTKGREQERLEDEGSLAATGSWTIEVDRGQAGLHAGRLQGAASALSYEIETPEQQERLRDLLLETSSWLAKAIAVSEAKPIIQRPSHG